MLYGKENIHEQVIKAVELRELNRVFFYAISSNEKEELRKVKGSRQDLRKMLCSEQVNIFEEEK